MSQNIAISVIRSLFTLSCIGVLATSVSLMIGKFIELKTKGDFVDYLARFIIGLALLLLMVVFSIFFFIVVKLVYDCLINTFVETKLVVYHKAHENDQLNYFDDYDGQNWRNKRRVKRRQDKNTSNLLQKIKCPRNTKSKK